MIAIALVLVLTKLPIGWEQVVFKRFTNVLELGKKALINETVGKNCGRLVCLFIWRVFAYGLKDIKLPETFMYSLIHQ